MCLEPAIPLATLRVDDFNCTEGIMIILYMLSDPCVNSLSMYCISAKPVESCQSRSVWVVELASFSLTDTEFQITNTEGVSCQCVFPSN